MKTGVQRIIGNARNLLRDASIVSAEPSAPSNLILPLGAERSGSGRVRLTGPYTGDADAEIELEITSTAVGDQPVVSRPAFRGIGSGVIEIGAVAAEAPAQTVRITLADLGTLTRAATAELTGGITLRARASGTGGNGITVTVDRAGIEYAPAGTLLEGLGAGTTTLRGPQWDFGGRPLTAGGDLDPASPRLVIGSTWPVYRQWREFDAGEWVYRLHPAPPVPLARDTPVRAVSGTYTVTVELGAESEQYTGIRTLFDLLHQLRERSALVEVVGVIAEDRTAQGMASIELPLHTAAYALPPSASGSRYATHLEVESVAADAPAQLIEIECVDNAVVGGERWSVRSSADGLLSAQAVTGVPYIEAGAAFRVPRKSPPASHERGRLYIEDIRWAQRTDEEGVPAICLHRPVLGARARDRDIVLTWTRRPPEECSCDSAPMEGRPLAQCLGIDVIKEDPNVSGSAEFLARLEDLYEFRAGFVAGNTVISARPEVAQLDVELVNATVQAFLDGLLQVSEDTAARTQWDTYWDAATTILNAFAETEGGTAPTGALPLWQAETLFAQGQRILPTTRNGHTYRASNTGTTGADEPTFETDGSLTADGTIQWEDLGAYWSATAAVTAGQVVNPGNGYRYRAQDDGTTGSTEPVWATSGATITDGSVVWEIIQPAADDVIEVQGRYEVRSGFTETRVVFVDAIGGVTEIIQIFPHTPLTQGGTVEEIMAQIAAATSLAGSLNRALATRRHPSGAVETIVQQFRAEMDHCLAIAGIVPPKTEASRERTPCWHDPGHTHYWRVNGNELLPLFNGVYYHSTKRQYNADTDRWELVHTMEFGVGLLVGCPERLQEGDQVVLRSSGSANARAYEVGDLFTLPVVAAAPLPLAGGVDGDDTLTWAVASTEHGALADYTLDLTDPQPYAEGDVPFILRPGGIPWQLGDQYEFALEGGEFRWRYAGGSWHEEIPIAASVALDDGIEAEFVRGAAPSYAAGDRWRWRLEQPYGPAELRAPVPGAGHAWSGSGQTLTVDLGNVQEIDVVLIALHTLPEGAAVTLWGGLAVADEWSEAIPWRAGPMAAILAEPRTARHLRLVVTGATDATIGWWWVGLAWASRYSATTCRLERQYSLAAGAGLNPGGLYRGSGTGGELAWQLGAPVGGPLRQGELDALISLIDHAKRHGDEALCLIPHRAHPEDAHLVTVATDLVEIREVHELVPHKGAARSLAVRLPLRGVRL